MVFLDTTLLRGALFIACAILIYSPTYGNFDINIINTNMPFFPNASLLKPSLYRQKESSEIYELIKVKASEMKHLLEDDQLAIPVKEDKFTFKSNGDEREETTIIEIMPHKSRNHKDSSNEEQTNFKSDMVEYNHMRRAINTALAREHVSDNIKLMVTAIIDDLMAKKVAFNSPMTRFLFRSKPRKTKPLQMARMWAQVWNTLRSQHSKIKKTNAGNRETFYKDFENFVDVLIRDLEVLKENYQVSYDMIEQDGVELIRKFNKREYSLENNQFENPATKEEFEGRETTIIEIMPHEGHSRKAVDYIDKNSSLKSHNDILKYQVMRRKINAALARELVTDKTKVMVTGIIDDLMSKNLEQQNTWHSSMKSVSFRDKPRVPKPLEMVAMWTQAWNKLMFRYSKIKTWGGEKDKEKFFRDFENFVGDVFRDMEMLSENHKVSFKLIEGDGVDTAYRRTGSIIHSKIIARQSVNNKLEDEMDITVRGKEGCANFKVCSKELIEFLANFYKRLKKTVVSALQNYCEMFKNDVDPEVHFKRNDVLELVQKIASKVDSCVDTVFRKRVRKFQLDDKHETNSRMQALHRLIRKSIKGTKKHVRSLTVINLKHLRPELYEKIKKDVDVKLDEDLHNLERELVRTICTVFETCNGKPSENTP